MQTASKRSTAAAHPRWSSNHHPGIHLAKCQHVRILRFSYSVELHGKTELFVMIILFDDFCNDDSD